MTTTWTRPAHSKKAVRRAGEVIGESQSTAEQVSDAKEIVSNFRSSHSYPLNAVTMHVRQRAMSLNPDAVVARRLKRLPTIVDKLERHPRMNVTTMQDLGGCRVILPNVQGVEELVQSLVGAKRARNHIVRTYDYINQDPGPKASGYRGVHLVYEYSASKIDFQGLRVELQVRTDLQHAWATAVETMDLFSGSELKYDKADPVVRRYFAVVASLMAYEEDRSLVPGADNTRADLLAELSGLEKQTGIINLLRGYAAIVGEHARTNRRSALTLELKRNERVLTVVVHETLATAEARLADLEALEDDNLDVVLVGIAQVGQLQAAYPNYYANTSVFTTFVSNAIAS